MTDREDSAGEQPGDSEGAWYARAPEEVTAAFGVDPAVGLSVARSAELLTAHGPNALPEEQPTPARPRFLKQYRGDTQLVLVAAAVVSLLIQDGFRRVLGTKEIDAGRFGRALPTALALLLLWELGKLLARRSRDI